MGGFLGIGGSSAKTDRADQLQDTQNEFKVFQYGLPAGETGQAQGQAQLAQANATLNPAQNYFQQQLTAGRAQTAENAAPAINATLAQTDAQRTQAGNFGTARTGGTAALNQEAGTAATSRIDDIISKTLLTQKQEGAAGLEKVAGERAAIGNSELANAMGLLGLSQQTASDLLENATESRQISFEQQQAVGAGIGGLAVAGLNIAESIAGGGGG